MMNERTNKWWASNDQWCKIQHCTHKFNVQYKAWAMKLIDLRVKTHEATLHT